jgi:hypothetical protein
MPGVDARPIAADAIPAIATTMESRHKSFAAVYGFFLVIIVIAAVGMIARPSHDDLDQGVMTGIAGGLIWFVPFAFAVRRRLRRARVAKAAGTAAKIQPNITWHLAERELVAADGGVVRVELSFPITSGLQKTLLAVPRASVV